MRIRKIGMIPRIHRISIDIDTFNQFEFLRKYFNAKNTGLPIRVFITGHGYHIQLFKQNRTSSENMHLRHMIGDCSNRLDLDTERLAEGLDDIIETLFCEKTVDSITTFEEIFNPLSQSFWMVNY